EAREARGRRPDRAGEGRMSTTEPHAPASTPPLLEVEHLVVEFPIKRGVLFDRTIGQVHAVSDVSLALAEGETLGVVGESGCGKTTLARAIARLVDATDGRIRFRGRDITHAGRREL